jgi:hypothetical protein
MRARSRVREVVPEVMPRAIVGGKAIPLPPTSSHRPTEAQADDPTPQDEELAAALSAQLEAVSVAAAAAEPPQETRAGDATTVEETGAPPMHEGVPVALTKPQTVPRAARQAERTDQQEATQLQETASAADNETVDIVTEEICEIAVWRGYAKSVFYGRLDASVVPEGTELAVAESPPFRFRGNGEPDRTEAAEAAYNALVERLVADGWELDASGNAWYASRFRRPLTRT